MGIGGEGGPTALAAIPAGPDLPELGVEEGLGPEATPAVKAPASADGAGLRLVGVLLHLGRD